MSLTVLSTVSRTRLGEVERATAGSTRMVRSIHREEDKAQHNKGVLEEEGDLTAHVVLEQGSRRLVMALSIHVPPDCFGFLLHIHLRTWTDSMSHFSNPLSSASSRLAELSSSTTDPLPASSPSLSRSLTTTGYVYNHHISSCRDTLLTL